MRARRPSIGQPAHTTLSPSLTTTLTHHQTKFEREEKLKQAIEMQKDGSGEAVTLPKAKIAQTVLYEKERIMQFIQERDPSGVFCWKAGVCNDMRVDERMEQA